MDLMFLWLQKLAIGKVKFYFGVTLHIGLKWFVYQGIHEAKLTEVEHVAKIVPNAMYLSAIL